MKWTSACLPAFAAMLVLPAGLAFAQERTDRPDSAVGGYEVEIERSPLGRQTMPSFREVDADNSGFVDREEAKAVSGLMFPDADENKDGRLSPSEFEAAVTVRPREPAAPEPAR